MTTNQAPFKIVATFRNDADCTEGRVAEYAETYNVVLWDLDADAPAPGARIFPKSLDGAREKAEALALSWSRGPA